VPYQFVLQRSAWRAPCAPASILHVEQHYEATHREETPFTLALREGGCGHAVSHELSAKTGDSAWHALGLEQYGWLLIGTWVGLPVSALKIEPFRSAWRLASPPRHDKVVRVFF
jgi:hypothetical protein